MYELGTFVEMKNLMLVQLSQLARRLIAGKLHAWALILKLNAATAIMSS